MLDPKVLACSARKMAACQVNFLMLPQTDLKFSVSGLLLSLILLNEYYMNKILINFYFNMCSFYFSLDLAIQKYFLNINVIF